jgi:aspartate aminotransferase
VTLVASRLADIAFSQTLAMGRRAAAMCAAGRDVISLGLGEPDIMIPERIRVAAAEAAHRGEGRSPPVEGIGTLREAIAEKFARDNRLSYDVDQILVSSGSKQVIFNAMMATLNPGDEVIIPAPYWVSYPEIVKLAGGTPVPVPCRASVGHKLSAESLEERITHRTRWLILNSPNNPSGAVYCRDELLVLAEVLRRHPGVLVLSDDIYEFFVYDPARFSTIASVAPDLYERTLTVNGFSKIYSMIGWRIGYGGGPRGLIEAMLKVQSQINSGTATIVQAGAVEALGIPRAELAAAVAVFQARRARVLQLLMRMPGLSCHPPDGAFYVYPDCSAYMGATLPGNGRPITNDEDLAEFLLTEAAVVTVPGSAFGLGPALRMSYTCPEDRLEEAFARIAQAFGTLDTCPR